MNAGTRGLDAMGRLIYVPTALDRALQPATLAGGFRLVLISGNAGDGKTAFIQQVEDEARQQGADVKPYGTGNGTSILATAQLAQAEHLDMLHVPYKGDAPATADLIAG